MAPRLKVFEWSDGFHRFTVAAASRPKALAAWGIHQDIFASGLAREALKRRTPKRLGRDPERSSSGGWRSMSGRPVPERRA